MTTIEDTVWGLNPRPEPLSGSVRESPNVRETDLHYLGGVVDSDGSFNIRVEKDDVVVLGYRVRPRFELMMKEGNGTGAIRELLVEALEDEDIQHSVRREFNYSKTSDNLIWSVRVNGKQAVLDFGEFIKPYLRHKGWQVDLILEQDWFLSGKSTEEKREQIIAQVECREQLRSGSRDTQTKYTPETMKEKLR